jgi:hypothetical protein
VLSQILSERIAIVLTPELNQHSQRKTAAPEFEPEVLKGAFGERHTVPRTLYFKYCITHSVCRQVAAHNFVVPGF